MSSLKEYLVQKRNSLEGYKSRVLGEDYRPGKITATAAVAGRSGVRHIQTGSFNLISDASEELAGYNLGPSASQFLLSAIASCVSHTTVLQLVAAGVEADAIEVDVTADKDDRGGFPGYEATPRYPTNLRYELKISSEASPEEIAGVAKAVDETCPILNLIRGATQIDHSMTLL